MLDLLPVVTGNKFVLRSVSTEEKYGLHSVPTDDEYRLLPVPNGSEYWLLPVATDEEVALLLKVVGIGLVPPHGASVDGEHRPPLAIVENRPTSLSVPAVDGRILTSAKAGRRRGLRLAGVGNELDLLFTSVVSKYIPLPGLSNIEFVLLTALVGCGDMSLSTLTGIEYNRLLALVVADLLLYRLVKK